MCARANLLRLGATAWSSEAYALVHAPIGAKTFDAIQAALGLTLLGQAVGAAGLLAVWRRKRKG